MYDEEDYEMSYSYYLHSPKHLTQYPIAPRDSLFHRL